MLKFALAIALFLISGCATIIGDEPGDEAGMMQEPQGVSDEEQRNADLKAEANALRESIRLHQDELDQLNQAE